MTLIHEKAYFVLRTALQEGGFNTGYSLPRFLPPDRAYNWTPPSNTNVETLTIPGEEILLEDVVTSSIINESIDSQHSISGDDDTDTECQLLWYTFPTSFRYISFFIFSLL